MMAEPWFVEAFRAGYLDLYPHRSLDAARGEARYLVERDVRGRVIDLGCGSGRHCIALRDLGVEAFGLDLSVELLARGLGSHSELGGRILRADVRALPLASGSLDAAVSLFSSFGYFDEAGDRSVLEEAGRVLRARGVLVLDLLNPTRVRVDLVPLSRSSRGGLEIEERRSLEDGGRRVVKEVRVRGRDGAMRRWREDVRLYEPAELEPWLGGAGIALEAVHGDFDASPPTDRSARRILVGRKR